LCVGILLGHLGRHDEAHRSFSAAISINPTANYTYLGQVYQDFEQWGHAFDSYRSALERDPTDVLALFGSAQVGGGGGCTRIAVRLGIGF
jgi:tetratricopeptide (TPR) repeat protein